MKQFASRLRRIGVVANPDKPGAEAHPPGGRRYGTGRAPSGLRHRDSATCGNERGSRGVPCDAGWSDRSAHCAGRGRDDAARRTRGVRIRHPAARHQSRQSRVSNGGVPEQLPSALRKLWEGRFELEERSLLEADVRQGSSSATILALNDVVLARGRLPPDRTGVEVNGELLTRYRCDGLIASSPRDPRRIPSRRAGHCRTGCGGADAHPDLSAR